MQETATITPAGKQAPESLFSVLDKHMELLDAFLSEQVGEFEPAVRELVRYTFLHRGKRLRPALVFYAGRTDSEPSPELVRAAAIVELVHLATLVHDDILDTADIRHGTRTVAAKFGQHHAVLLGDALFAQALKLASEFPTTEVCRLVATATRQVCSGEICQTFARGDAALSLEQYFRIIRLKTAELFEVSCRVGAGLAYPEIEYADACATFGRHLGIAYQIFDDIADFSGDEAAIGKTLGTDIASGKFTLPVLLYLQTLQAPQRDALLDALRGQKISPAELASKMKAANIPARCAEIFEEETRKAETALAPHAEKPSAELLLAILAYVRRVSARLTF